MSGRSLGLFSLYDRWSEAGLFTLSRLVTVAGSSLGLCCHRDFAPPPDSSDIMLATTKPILKPDISPIDLSMQTEHTFVFKDAVKNTPLKINK